MTDIWSLIATQIPAAVAIALLVLQMRKSESEERHANTEKWQAFLKLRDEQWLAYTRQRDEQWQGFLSGYQRLEETVIGTLIGQMDAVSKQMAAVTEQMKAMQVAVVQFSTTQELTTAELREFMRKCDDREKKRNDDKQPNHS